ncbi:MAG: DNA translocase FtsK [Deltaproteobacteria bacterium]|nr:MAG: DNA translocase FtsK [Deltaproteobacteria bacterium]
MVHEVEAVVSFALGAVLALSFVSYVPESPTLNRVGPVGYFIADTLVQAFGYAAYLFPLLLAIGAVALFTQRSSGLGSPMRLAGAAFFLVEIAVLLGLLRAGHPQELAGGWVGGFLATVLEGWLGAAGAGVIVGALVVLTWILLTGRPLSEIAGIAARLVRRGAVAAGRGVAIAVRAGARKAVAAISNLRLPERRRVRKPVVETSEERPVVFGHASASGGGDPKIEQQPPSPRKSKRKTQVEAEQEEFVFDLDRDDYRLPPVRLLGKPDDQTDYADEKTLVAQSKILEQKLATFGVAGRVTAVRPGPVITTFEFEPDAGIKVSRVVNLCDDLTMALRAHGVRIVAPIPGKNVVGIEVSNRHRAIVGLRDLIDSDDFREYPSPLTLALGRDTTGLPVYADLTKMPHLLMAGATGTGKSVSLNSMILSMLYKSTPRDVRFIMIDPKMLEMSLYEGIPHLLVPVVTDVKKAAAALQNVMREMDRRFELMKALQVRNIDDYNRRVAEEFEDVEEEEYDEEEYEEDLYEEDEGEEEDGEEYDEEDGEEDEEELEHEHLPRIVVIVDELADLMMTVGREVETSITRLAQKARAAGIHLIVATQRPSVDVITGLIKANFPSRISFQVTSRPDSRTILDTVGAERLLGNGDMLYLAPGTSHLQRLHGAFVSDKEIRAIVSFLAKQGGPDYRMDLLEDHSKAAPGEEEEEFFDELYDRAVDLVIENGQGSTSWLQRKLGIGYNRAARIMEHMEREGIVGPADGSKPRKVLVGSTAS